jgi:hypothetical protein
MLIWNRRNASLRTRSASTRGGHVGDVDVEAAHLPLDDVGDVGHLGVPGRSVPIDQSAFEELLVAGQGALDGRKVKGVDGVSEDLADVSATG